MRRSVFFLTPLIPFALAGCEDGPAQTFQPATGTLFNNGDTPAVVTDAGDPLTSTFGGTTATQICSGQQLQLEWSEMITQPLAPVRYMAGLDMAGGPTFELLTIDSAENGYPTPGFPIQNACVTESTTDSSGSPFGYTPGGVPPSGDACLYSSGTTLNTQTECQALAQQGKACGWNAIPATPAFLATNPAPKLLCQPNVLGAGANNSQNGGSIVSGWGNNNEFTMEWAIPTHKALVLSLNPGYNGQLQWNYRTPAGGENGGDGKVHTYVYELSLPIKKDNVNFEIDWLEQNKFPAQVDELYRGIASTYAPDIYDNAPPGVACNATGTCLALANGEDGTGRALFGMRPVSFYMFFDPPTLPNPSGFTVSSAYLFNIKYAPYSGISSYFKMYDGPLDGGGLAAGGDPTQAEPFADGYLGTLPGKTHCHFSTGQNFENLLDNCIKVFAIPPGCAPGDISCDPNVTAQNKVLGDLSHDDQNYSFAVVGINQNFRPVKLDVCNPALIALGTNCGTDTQDVIHDTDTPLADPTNTFANTFASDVRSFGPIQNDFAPPGSIVLDANPLDATYEAPIQCKTDTDCQPPSTGVQGAFGVTGGTVLASTGGATPAVCDTNKNDTWVGYCVSAAWSTDYHGSGAVWREYGRLVQQDLNSKYVAQTGNSSFYKSWHDPSCSFPEGCVNKTTGAIINGQTPTSCNYNQAVGTPAVNANYGTGPGAWGVLPFMELTPLTSCAADSDCTKVNSSAVCNCSNAATCSQNAVGSGGAGGSYGLQAGTCVTKFDVTSWRAPPGCTGFENWISAAETAPQDWALEPTDDLWDVNGFAPSGIGGGFKPGEPLALFCNDPGTFDNCGLNGDVQGVISDLIGGSISRVIQYLGTGDILNLPPDGRDRQYYFAQWLTAYVKYLTSAAVLDTGVGSGGSLFGVPPGSTGNYMNDNAPFNGLQVDQLALATKVETGTIATNYIDSDNFIFDSFGGGTGRSEYVDFDVANLSNDPVDIEQLVLLLGTNLQGTNYYRKLDREERALFNVLAIDNPQNDPAPAASWGYLGTPAARIFDAWALENSKTGRPITCTTVADCTNPANNPVSVPGAPPVQCDTNTADLTYGECVFEYPRRNANPFLTNMAGSTVLTTGDPLIGNITATWQTPLQADWTTPTGLPLVRRAAPAGWVDPCNPVPNPPVTCTTDQDCPGLLACSYTAYGSAGPPPGVANNTCVPAVTGYFCATHSYFDNTLGGAAIDGCLDGAYPGDFGNKATGNGSSSWMAPLNSDNLTLARRADGKPLLEGYCGAWQPNPFSLTTTAVTPSTLVPQGAYVNTNANGNAAGIQIVKTFPDEGEALVSLPTFANPYAPYLGLNKNPVLVIVPWLPFQEGVGYDVATNGSQDIFVETAQLDFTGQVLTPVLDFLPAPLPCFHDSDCSGGLTCQNATNEAPDSGVDSTAGQCLAAGDYATDTNPAPPYGINIKAWETQDYLGAVFLCIDYTSAANRWTFDTPGDVLAVPMNTSAESIISWLSTHPNAQTDCQIVVRYSPYDNYPSEINSLSAGVRLDIASGAGFGRVVDAAVFAPGTGVAATP